MTKQIIREHNDGLILRHATQEDTAALVKFNKEIHGEGEWDEKGLEDWTLDLISGEGPTCDAGDITIVENTKTGEIVSSCCLISQTWAYEDIPFKVGRPELVGTHPAYRRQGLVRQQFEVLHHWSKERGELVQAITGIPYYYRQFGYEMTLNLGGGRSGDEMCVPKLSDGEEEPYTFRPANPDDLPFLMKIYESGCQRSMVYALWDEALWHYELTGKRKYNINKRDIFIIENKDGKSAGFIGIPVVKWRTMSALTLYELAPGYSWSEVTPSVVRFLWQKGEQLAEEQNQEQKLFGFWLGETHPAYDAFASKLPRQRKPYSFYIRVPDQSAFIKKISPVLDDRLASSAFANYSGTIDLCFYRNGLQLVFEQGHITTIGIPEKIDPESATACFPPLVFLHLLFGYRTMDELDHAFTDCYARDDESKNLLDTLFPKKPSDVWVVS